MRVSRPCILLATAILFIWWAMRESNQHEKAPSSTVDSLRRDPHLGEMSQEETSAWLRRKIQAPTDSRLRLPRERELAIACEKLGASECMALLKEIEKSYIGPGFGRSNEPRQHLLHLQPLWNLLLEQIALDDLKTALKSFPSEAKVLLKAASKKNGYEALEVWNEVRTEQRRGFHRNSRSPSSEWREGVGKVPVIALEDRESAASAALAEGWAASDSEAAWTALTSGQMKGIPASAILRGFFRGLPVPADWPAWSHRIESLPWKDTSNYLQRNSHGVAAVALTRRWLESDPDQAIAWFLQDKESWPPDVHVPFPSDESAIAFNSGTTGRATFVSPHTFLLADWMKADPKAASFWLSEASETLAPKEVLQDIASEMAIPESLKAQIAARYGN